ncbi:hypothetical protein EC968_005219 [Mortierella alpina]|nr:hypothetical protein EC968_005219 [Mortierella alpina]
MKISTLIWSFIITLILTYAGPVKEKSRAGAKCPAKRPKNEYSLELSAFYKQATDSGLQYLAYYGHITIGRPPQTFRVNIYLSSNRAPWVIDNLCQNTALKFLRKFRSAVSITYKELRMPYWDASYSKGSTTTAVKSVNGVYGSDSLLVGNLALQSTTIGLARNVYDEFADNGVSGVLSLGPMMQDPTTKAPTFMKAAIDQGIISNPTFLVYLPPSRHGPSASGEIVFGNVGSERYQGDLTYAAVVDGANARRWVLEIDDISFNDNSIGMTGRAVLDITFALIEISSQAARALHKDIAGAVEGPRVGIAPQA